MSDLNAINDFLANGAPLILIVFAVLWHFGIVQKLRDFLLSNFTAKGKLERKRVEIQNLIIPEKVALFARTYLPKCSEADLMDPLKTDYDVLEYFDVKAPIDLEHEMYGHFLFEEITHCGTIGIWLDWKYNLLTLLFEDEYDDLLNKLFEQNNLAPITQEERVAILGEAADDPSKFEGHRGFLLSQIQHLATKRDRKLLQVFNNSDSSLLIVLPIADADLWDGIEFGEVQLTSED